MMPLFKSSLFLILAMALSACSSMVHVKPPISRPPLVEKAPISVGVFYSENLLHHKCIVSKGYIAESWVIELGPESVEMFSTIFAGFFEKSVTVDSVGSGIEKGLESVIEVDLLYFNGDEASWPIVGARIKVAYKVTLYGKDGTIIGEWRCRGEAASGDSSEGCRNKGFSIDVEGLYLGAMTCVAMRRAAADFIVNFENDPGVRAYWGK